VPREWIVLSKISRVIIAARVVVGSPRKVISEWSGFDGLSHRGRGISGGVARASSLSKWVWTAAMTSWGGIHDC
jgi:hypothetical protein